MLSEKNTCKGKKNLCRCSGCNLTSYVLDTLLIKVLFCHLYCLPVLVLAPIFNRVRFAVNDPVFCFSDYIPRIQVNGVIFARLDKFLKFHFKMVLPGMLLKHSRRWLKYYSCSDTMRSILQLSK